MPTSILESHRSRYGIRMGYAWRCYSTPVPSSTISGLRRSMKHLVERMHDPLGLELLLHGTIRGQTVRAEDWERRPIGSVGALGDKFRVSIAIVPGRTADRNTERIGIAVLERKP